MQLENGKIIAIRTAFKVGGAGKGSAAQHQESKPSLEKAEVTAPEYKKGELSVSYIVQYCSHYGATGCRLDDRGVGI
jgi:hypothetical protein